MSATMSVPDAPTTTPSKDWRKQLAPYERPSVPRALLDLATSIVPFVALVAAIIVVAPSSFVAALLLTIPAAGFQLRTFMVFHDCTHGSFLPSRRANRWLGRVLGVVVWTPFGEWKHSHAAHHATAGDLDRRGHGDVPTMTVAEYQEATPGARLLYRLFRHPAILLTIGPFVAMMITPRFYSKGARARIRNSVLLNDLALLVFVVAFCLLFGWQTFLLLQIPLTLMAGGAGVWLFFVQHQFEDVYWKRGEEWSYRDAALQGASYLRLPKVLQFFTGNIGLHHVHHLSHRIPNYNLQAAHDENDVFHSVPVLTLGPALRSLRLKLWDEENGRLVPFSAAAQPAAAA
ncbi:MAG: fatty acid desaturase [Patulibacter sp.]